MKNTFGNDPLNYVCVENFTKHNNYCRGSRISHLMSTLGRDETVSTIFFINLSAKCQLKQNTSESNEV